VELAAYPAILPTFDRGTLERRVRGKLADWRGLLTRDVVAGNATLPAGFAASWMPMEGVTEYLRAA
jgi:hypothetical protein